MDISVIVPLFNEEESLPELFAWIKRVMNANDFTYEVIFVNDGSTDRSWDVQTARWTLPPCWSGWTKTPSLWPA